MVFWTKDTSLGVTCLSPNTACQSLSPFTMSHDIFSFILIRETGDRSTHLSLPATKAVTCSIVILSRSRLVRHCHAGLAADFPIKGPMYFSLDFRPYSSTCDPLGHRYQTCPSRVECQHDRVNFNLLRSFLSPFVHQPTSS